jgi:uncharacterized membrane protein YgcG
MVKLYTKSKTPANDWNGDDLSLLGVNRRSVINGLFENKNCAVVISIRNDGETQHLFAPVLADKLNQDDSISKGALVVGNAVDDMNYFQPMSCSSSIFDMAVAFIKKEDAHPVFKDHNTIPVEHLKGTSLAKEKNIIAVYFPNAAPFQYQSVVPYGNISDDEVQRVLANSGGEYEFWGKMMKLFHENYDDYHTILGNIIEAKQQKSFIAAEYGKKDGVKVADFAPYTNHTIIRKHDEVPEAINHLKAIFGEKNMPEPMVVESKTIVQNPSLPPTFVLSRPEDEDKAKKSESIVSKLKILMISTENELDITNENCEIVPAAPELATEVEEVVLSKGSDASKAEELQAIIEASFADNPSLANLAQPKSAVSTAKSLIVFPKASASQLLKGKFQTQPANALIKDSATLGPLALLYQNNVGNKADIIKDQEDIQDAEEAQNIPDSQRTSRKATVEVVGSLTSLSDALGLMANILHLVLTLIKLIGGRPKPIIYSLMTYLFNFCSSNPFQIWALRHKDKHPYLHVYLFTLVQHVWIAFAQTAALPVNQVLAKTNSFSRMSTDYIRSAISEVATAVRDFRKKFISDQHWDIIPSITPPELNPVALEKKRMEELIASLAPNPQTQQQQRGKLKTGQQQTGGENTGDGNNSNGSNGGGGGGGRSKSKARRPGGRATINRKKLGVVSPIDGKNLTPAILMPKDLGLTKTYCFHWLCTGTECTREDCKFEHATFTSMAEDDRSKLLKHMADTNCATLNPALANNPRVVAMIPDDLKTKLFPSSSGASDE